MHQQDDMLEELLCFGCVRMDISAIPPVCLGKLQVTWTRALDPGFGGLTLQTNKRRNLRTNKQQKTKQTAKILDLSPVQLTVDKSVFTVCSSLSVAS